MSVRAHLRGLGPRDWAAVLAVGTTLGLYGFGGAKLGLFVGVYLIAYPFVGGVLLGARAGRSGPAVAHSGVAIVVALLVQYSLSVVDDLVLAARYPFSPLYYAGAEKIPPDFASRLFMFASWELVLHLQLWFLLLLFGTLLGAVVGAWARTRFLRLSRGRTRDAG